MIYSTRKTYTADGKWEEVRPAHSGIADDYSEDGGIARKFEDITDTLDNQVSVKLVELSDTINGQLGNKADKSETVTSLTISNNVIKVTKADNTSEDLSLGIDINPTPVTVLPTTETGYSVYSGTEISGRHGAFIIECIHIGSYYLQKAYNVDDTGYIYCRTLNSDGSVRSDWNIGYAQWA